MSDWTESPGVPPMPETVRVERTEREWGTSAVKVARVTFTDPLGDARVLDLGLLTAGELLVGLIDFLQHCASHQPRHAAQTRSPHP